MVLFPTLPNCVVLNLRSVRLLQRRGEAWFKSPVVLVEAQVREMQQNVAVGNVEASLFKFAEELFHCSGAAWKSGLIIIRFQIHISDCRWSLCSLSTKAPDMAAKGEVTGRMT